jgi:DnaJ-class molecular chaperone
MQHEPYQDLQPEVPCPECGGAGFFGNGPVVEPCDICRGKGVLINESVTLKRVRRKPIGRERRKRARDVKTSGA